MLISWNTYMDFVEKILEIVVVNLIFDFLRIKDLSFNANFKKKIPIQF